MTQKNKTNNNIQKQLKTIPTEKRSFPGGNNVVGSSMKSNNYSVIVIIRTMPVSSWCPNLTLFVFVFQILLPKLKAKPVRTASGVSLYFIP